MNWILLNRRSRTLARVLINRDVPLFMDGVRTKEKRQVLALVDREFHRQARAKKVKVRFGEIRKKILEDHLNKGGAVITLISTYRRSGKKAPHWVTITGMDQKCFYLHDPSPASTDQIDMDCKHIPVARADFDKMTTFGKQRLRTAVLISR